MLNVENDVAWFTVAGAKWNFSLAESISIENIERNAAASVSMELMLRAMQRDSSPRPELEDFISARRVRNNPAPRRLGDQRYHNDKPALPRGRENNSGQRQRETTEQFPTVR